MTRDVSRAVLFDYGGVLGDHHILAAESRLSHVLRTDIETMRRLLSEKSPQGRAVRCGEIDEHAFWLEVARLQGLEKLPASVEVLTRLWCETYAPSQALFALARGVRRLCNTGVITNIDAARSSYLVEHVNILDVVDLYIPSYSLGITKGDPTFWSVIAAYLESQGIRDALYVDDRTEHVTAAQARGIHAVRYEGSAPLLKQAVEHWISRGSEKEGNPWAP